MFPSFQVCSRPLKNQHEENSHLIFSGVASKFPCFVASWQPIKKASFVFCWASSTTLPNLQQQSLHMGRFLVQPEQQSLHVERKWNQIRSLPTAQSNKRAKGSQHPDHPSFWGTTWDKTTLLCREHNKEFGVRTPAWTFLTAQDTLGSQAKPGTRSQLCFNGQHWGSSF